MQYKTEKVILVIQRKVSPELVKVVEIGKAFSWIKEIH